MKIPTRPTELTYFFNREVEIKELFNNFQNNWNTAIVGHRRTGKTFLCYKFLSQIKNKDDKTIPVLIDIRENAGLGMRGLSLHILKTFLESYLNKNRILSQEDFLKIQTIPLNKDFLNKLKIKLNDLSINNILDFYSDYYLSKKINNEYIFIEKIIDFLISFVENNKLKLILIFDEFQDIIRLEKTKKSNITKSSIIPLISSKLEKSENIWFCITGSLINMMERILNSPESALYGRLKIINFKPFSNKISIDFIYKLIEPKEISSEALKQILTVSSGNPYYITKIIQLIINKQDKIIRLNDIDKSLIDQVIRGELNNHCLLIFETINQYYKQKSLYDILEFIAYSEKISIFDLKLKFKKNVNNLINRLRDLSIVDIEIIENKKYVFLIDNIFLLWLQNRSENPEFFSKKLKLKLKKDFEKENQELKTQLGKLIEYKYIYSIREKSGHEIKGVRIPKFKSLARRNFKDEKGIVFGYSTNIEIDALGLGTENWLFEFKNRERSIRYNEIKRLEKISIFLKDIYNINIDKICIITLFGIPEKLLDKIKHTNIIIFNKSDFF